MLFQWVSNYSLWITSTTFSSNLAEVDVYDGDIPATSIGISGDDYVVNTTVSTSNSSSSGTDSVTSQFTSTTDPSNATGDITWTTSDSSIATIDNSGLLTVVSNGTVTITVTITNADGTTYSSSKTITIGNGLDDQTVDAGDDLTWEPNGSYTSSADDSDVTYQWYYSTTADGTGTALVVKPVQI